MQLFVLVDLSLLKDWFIPGFIAPGFRISRIDQGAQKRILALPRFGNWQPAIEYGKCDLTVSICAQNTNQG